MYRPKLGLLGLLAELETDGEERVTIQKRKLRILFAAACASLEEDHPLFEAFHDAMQTASRLLGFPDHPQIH